MLIAYLDEIGETGAFVSKEHDRFNTSPAFGYAGFVIPDGKAREFGGLFTTKKRQLFSREIAEAEVNRSGSESTWEMKGSDYFHKFSHQKNPERIRVFNGLIRDLLRYGGNVFYYADEKERGTPKQTGLKTEAREQVAMEESLNRLARHADSSDQNMLVIIDQINEKERKMRAHRMYGHVYSRSQTVDEMKRIIEAPMHLDSGISGSIQFADWIAAVVGRAIDYHLIEESKNRSSTGFLLSSAPCSLRRKPSLTNLNFTFLKEQSKTLITRSCSARRGPFIQLTTTNTSTLTRPRK